VCGGGAVCGADARRRTALSKKPRLPRLNYLKRCAMMATLESRTWETQDTKTSALGRFQFSLRSLLVATTLCALLAASWPWQWSKTDQLALSIYVGLLVIQFGPALWAIAARHRRRCASNATPSRVDKQLFEALLIWNVVPAVFFHVLMWASILGGPFLGITIFRALALWCLLIFSAQVLAVGPLLWFIWRHSELTPKLPLALLHIGTIAMSIFPLFSIAFMYGLSYER